MIEQFRPSQSAIIEDYHGGLMGISAVPGSGKTFTLSHLAARLVGHIADEGTFEEKEVLVVTMTNSAVNTFRHRIGMLLKQEKGLLPNFGYSVRTLHSLAHDIVRMRPGLVGLSESFEILDERVTTSIIRELADNWVKDNINQFESYFNEEAYSQNDNIKRYVIDQTGRLINDITRATITLAKDMGWDSSELMLLLKQNSDIPVLARAGIETYAGYQQSLSYRGAIDFDDLIRFAMDALTYDSQFLERLQRRWPYILEDEAQDSSEIQDRMLRLLSNGGNWVRVGDPNQSIFSTFTTADANILRQFLTRNEVLNMPLNVSGRSSQQIVDLANELVRWVSEDPTAEIVREAFHPQQIIPTPQDDPQQNPDNGLIHIFFNPGEIITPDDELRIISKSAGKYINNNPNKTCAILVPANTRGFKIVEILNEEGIPCEELLRSTNATRSTAEKLGIILSYLAEPINPGALARVFEEVWWPLMFGDENDHYEDISRERVRKSISKYQRVEDFIWPGIDSQWMDDTYPDELTASLLREFRERIQYWLNAASLPIDQLILTIGRDLFDSPPDLALSFKLAGLLKGIQQNYPDHRLPELALELSAIANNERRFLGFDEADAGFEPSKGMITVSTMHSAKGLEWDRVYLMSVSNYDYPLVQEGDTYFAEKFFIRDDLNIQAEAIEQITRLIDGSLEFYEEGRPTADSRVQFASERLRLLYVGITRAKEDLAIIWNKGIDRPTGETNQPSQALIALYNHWKKASND